MLPLELRINQGRPWNYFSRTMTQNLWNNLLATEWECGCGVFAAGKCRNREEGFKLAGVSMCHHDQLLVVVVRSGIHAFHISCFKLVSV
jgi:hypothetical protein